MLIVLCDEKPSGHDVNRIIKTYINTPMDKNISKAEHLALENLRKDMGCIIITTKKCGPGCNGQNGLHYKI